MKKRLSGRQLVRLRLGAALTRLSASTVSPFGVNLRPGADQTIGKNHWLTDKASPE
jgi:hypothetical protein